MLHWSILNWTRLRGSSRGRRLLIQRKDVDAWMTWRDSLGCMMSGDQTYRSAMRISSMLISLVRGRILVRRINVLSRGRRRLSRGDRCWGEKLGLGPSAHAPRVGARACPRCARRRRRHDGTWMRLRLAVRAMLYWQYCKWKSVKTFRLAVAVEMGSISQSCSHTRWVLLR